MVMHDSQQTLAQLSALPPSSRQRLLLRKLLDHYCGVYLVRFLEGYIHNLNSPLQILWVRSEQLEQDITHLQQAFESDDRTQAAELGKTMQSRINSLLKSLNDLNSGLAFLSEGFLFERRSKTKQIEINDVIEDTLFLLNANMSFKHDVKRTIRLDDNLPKLRGRRADFCIIMISLVQNALEAMADAEEKHLTIETCRENSHIAIKVTDTGCGIPEQDRQDIYQAFLTTKRSTDQEGKTDEHAGIGLSLVLLLLDDYRGNIAFESQSGSTTFTVRLPLTAK